MSALNGWQLFILETFLITPPFIFAMICHELAHGYTARFLGDMTAEKAGRLTFNPLKHIDAAGLLCFLVIRIGWARPIPIGAAFKDDRKGLVLVALAGPAVNLLAAFVSYRVYQGILSLLPYLPQWLEWAALGFFKANVWINILLAVFNLMPFPPLDGFKVLVSLFPKGALDLLLRVEPYGILLLLVLFCTGTLQKIIIFVTTLSFKVLGIT